MSTHKYISAICVVVVILSLIVTVLFMNGPSLGIETVVDEDAESYSGTAYFTANDLNGQWDTSQAIVITLNGTDSQVSGSGVYTYDGNVVIAAGGYYVVSGELTEGSIIVDTSSSSKVWILLNGVNITCSDDACIRVDEADKVFLTLGEGTENTLESGAVYSDTALEDGTDGAIFAHDDLTINGSGTLTVSAGYKHGIAANDDLVITGGTILVSAVTDGIRANDSMRITNANITVEAGDDGLVVAEETGYLYVESGEIHITSQDDGIHTGADITIAGGEITIDAGDDGIHSDTKIDISDGSIFIQECYEGMEAPEIAISGGDIVIYPSDDGINANNGSQETGMFGGMGMPMNRQERPTTTENESMVSGTAQENASPNMTVEERNEDSEEAPLDRSRDMEEGQDIQLPVVHISGGTVTIINENGRDADGIDSNGDILISGGTIYISVTDGGTNSALDYGSENGGVCEISGGTIIACGSSGMAERFGSSSTQPSIFYTVGESAETGTVVALKDADGNSVLEYTVPCSFSSVIFSCPSLTLGETYQVMIGDEINEITLDETAGSYGEMQSAAFGGMNRGGFGGGRGGRPTENGGEANTNDMGQEPPAMPEEESQQGEGTDEANTNDMGQEPPAMPEGESQQGEGTDKANTNDMGQEPPAMLERESQSEESANGVNTSGRGQESSAMPEGESRPERGTQQEGVAGENGNHSISGQPPNSETTSQSGDNTTGENLASNEENSQPNAEMPQPGGDFGGGRAPGQDREQNAGQPSSEEISATVVQTQYSTDTWIMVGICVGILLIGIGIAYFYGKRG